ncbi:MAG: hypothetical protein HC880_05790 [Bacteroidia bacterium]|nr:hypothetical protein [Bacteroidia bacterium]
MATNPVPGAFFVDRRRAGKQDFSEAFAKLHYAPSVSASPVIRFHLILDVASMELFADDGQTVMTEIFFPNENFTQFQLFAEAGKIQLTSGKVYFLRSIW